MKRILAPALVAALALGLAAGCSSGSEEGAYPLPTAAINIPVPTQVGPLAGSCPSTDLGPILITWDAGHRKLTLGGQKVLLPWGFSGRMLPSGRLEILGRGGAVVARDGDTIRLGGADLEHVCRVQGVEY
jgi:hypothetical protein